MANEDNEKVDAELREYRDLMVPPDTFEEGFTWSSMFGAMFIGMIMVPGALYMSLLAGEGIGPAAQWVTVILFIEVARRAQRELKKSEIFVLYWMAAAAIGVPFSDLLWRQFFINSDAAVKHGVAADIPTWWVASADSVSYATRSFFHFDWWPVIGLIILGTFVGSLKSMVLGYGLFRVTSDVERLPFPMAPIGAQGIMALADDVDERKVEDSEPNWRWRTFAIGGAIGLAYGAVLYLLPIVSGAMTGTSVQILPLPFVDWTPTTGRWLPAVATGWSWDVGNIVIGMVLPFWAIIGSFTGLLITVVLNPILWRQDVLDNWQVGDGTVETLYHNTMDFYFSFGIGISLAIFAAGLIQMLWSIRRQRRKRREAMSEPSRTVKLKERGDIPWKWVIITYLVTTIGYILLCGWLIEWHRGVMIVMFIIGFVYIPMISYATARLEGIAGQVIEVPMAREAALILSQYAGAKVWFLPIPIANYGQMTVFYRQCELTGTKFTSIWKAQFFMLPMILVAGIFFMNFIWGLAPVPSSIYPYADVMWELEAEKKCIIYTATMGGYSQFEEAWQPGYLAAGAGFGALLFFVLTKLGAPIFLVYGVVRGLGQSMPHDILPQFVGAVIGRFYFRRKFGKKWLKYIPVVAAGVFCGLGLVSVLGVGITFLSKAVVQLPF
ncbi:MAG: OPT/YSL family transporter [Lentisphaeria bacterium]|jgi:hypothetical protein|nr:OPT/YSL family transporter [Lentisphaeria bacterium]MDP7743454.1 OPT/YSL family transporter [Lentisphaeria bacterium]